MLYARHNLKIVSEQLFIDSDAFSNQVDILKTDSEAI